MFAVRAIRPCAAAEHNSVITLKWRITIMRNEKVLKLSMTALFAALSYVAFMYLKIDLPGGVALHIGNAFCVLCALLLGGIYGGVAGSFGMTLADIMNPAYLSSAPKTFVLKLCIGLITGLVAHRIAGLSKQEHDADRSYQLRWVLLSSAAGLVFNIIFDPIVGYFYKIWILGVPADASSIMAKWSAAATFINAGVSIVLVTVVYLALRPLLKRAQLFVRL